MYINVHKYTYIEMFEGSHVALSQDQHLPVIFVESPEVGQPYFPWCFASVS